MTFAEAVLSVAAGIVLVLALTLKARKRGSITDILIGMSAVAVLSTLYLSDVAKSSSIFGRAIDYGSVVFGLLILSAAYLINAVAKSAIYPLRVTSEGDPTIPLLLQRLIGAFTYLVAIAIILQFLLDQSVTAIATASGALALVIGYSARNVLEELFAGLALYADEPFSKGDLIQVNDAWAIVKDVTWRSLTYMDMDENIVVVPNSVVAAASIRNLDRPSKLVRRTMNIRVEYNVPPRVVISECEAAMKDCPLILDHPWNYVAFLEFDEFGMKYRMAFYVGHYNNWFTASDELINAIWYRFARKKIRFAHQRKLNYIDSEDEQRGLFGSAYDDSSWRDLIAKFKSVPMFEGMTTDDMDYLAQQASLRVLGAPERIFEAGSETTSMFLIASGIADMYEVDGDGNETWMSKVEESETIGLMSLLTGSPPRTTVRARTEVAVWEIGSDSLHGLFQQKPEVMNNIAKNVAKWQAEEEEALDLIATNRSAKREPLTSRTNALKERIAAFFDRRDDNPEVIDEEPPQRPSRNLL